MLTLFDVCVIYSKKNHPVYYTSHDVPDTKIDHTQSTD